MKEVVGAVVANFPGKLRRILAVKSNLRLRLLEQQLRAHYIECTILFQLQEDMQYSVLCERSCWGKCR